ncbi:hypothetical protein [Actinomadura sp. 9N215]|uniref:hypothetical protein n=1 Tax=Actinomadura sp. 9N215 TaxID=3375150 RepID=UPI0037A6E63E
MVCAVCGTLLNRRDLPGNEVWNCGECDALYVRQADGPLLRRPFRPADERWAAAVFDDAGVQPSRARVEPGDADVQPRKADAEPRKADAEPGDAGVVSGRAGVEHAVAYGGTLCGIDRDAVSVLRHHWSPRRPDACPECRTVADGRVARWPAET